MIYTSAENELIKKIKKLQTKKNRDEENLFLVEGEHLIKEAYNSKVLDTLIIEENSKFNCDVKKIICNSKVMKYLSQLDTPSKMIGICKKRNNQIKGNKILALDNIQDPGNLGTIIRSCVAFNVDTILLSKDCVDIYNSKVVRASQGMIFHINIVVCDLKEILESLKDYKIIGTRLLGGNSIETIDFSNKCIIVMGNEGNGVSKDILDLCDEYLYINMNSNCESLNVAVATSIILYEISKRGD